MHRHPARESRAEQEAPSPERDCRLPRPLAPRVNNLAERLLQGAGLIILADTLDYRLVSRRSRDHFFGSPLATNFVASR